MKEFVVAFASPAEDAFRGKVLLIDKDRPPYLKGLLMLPGGKVQEGESPVDAAVRELKEETGLDELQEYDPMVYCPAEQIGILETADKVIYCVNVPVCSRQELNPNPTETERPAWYDLRDALKAKNLMPNLRIILPLMQANAKDWKIIDTGDWKRKYHEVGFEHLTENKIKKTSITIKGTGYYDEEE